MGKSGSSGSSATVNIPSGLYQTTSSETGLGQYASSLLNPIASMTNWAANLASGGTATSIPSFQSVATQAGPSVSGSNKVVWSSAFDPQTGVITFTAIDDPGRQMTASISNLGGQHSDLVKQIPSTTIQQWQQDYAQAKAGTTAGGSTTGGDLTSQLGPFLGTAWNAIKTQEGLTSQMAPVEAQTAALANEAATEGSSMMQMATTGSGLFPSQEAYITQARQTGETQAAAELAKLGLSNSTMAGQLQEQADLSAAATAGTLVQGNIDRAQASQKIALGAQTLETGEQQAVFDMWKEIASESETFQSNLWTEAMQGYGVLGNMINTAASSYGYSLKGYESILQAGEVNAQIQSSASQSAAQSDAQGTSSLISGIGSVIGGAASSAGGVTGLVSGIGSALTALFCQVAQTVYGFDNPKWQRFRAWLLLRSPLWFVRLYGRHAAAVSEWLSDKPALRWCIGHLMDAVSRC